MRLGTGFQALASVSVAALLTGGAWAQQPSITWLGTLPNGARSYAQGVSADGAVVAGYDEAVIDDEGVGGELRALRWTRTGGTTPLATRGANSQSLAVSADGRVIVGWTEHPNGWRAAKWGADGSLTLLGTLGGAQSAAYGVSANGAIVVGWADDATNRRAAVRWQADGTVDDLGVPMGFTMSWATGASADGSTLAANAYADRFRWQAFRWNASGWESLQLPAGYANSAAHALSADGAVIVGRAFNGLGVEDSVAVYWTPDGAIVSLGALGGAWSAAYGVSANGASHRGHCSGQCGASARLPMGSGRRDGRPQPRLRTPAGRWLLPGGCLWCLARRTIHRRRRLQRRDEPLRGVPAGHRA
jgi:probable HAF family extracellular repeat protein